MFETIPKELLEVVRYLLPGFVCAWVFYGLTSHPKPSQFERLIQALIYTFVIASLLIPVEWLLIWFGSKFFAVRAWDKPAEQLASFVLALLLGSGLACAVNTDTFHRLLRRVKLTSRTSHPSEWFCIFSEKVTFVILHLHDGRRLYGWPKEWPIERDKGQFYIMLPAWILDDGSQLDLPELDGVLMPAADVKWVEFLNNNEAQT